MSIVGLIPARGGSKGVPRKNLRTMGGRPLIAWTINAARASRYLDRVIVSTDDEEIAQVARSEGADVPFIRPAYLAQDATDSMQVILHALSCVEETFGQRPDILVLLQPTSPFRTAEDIDAAVQMARRHEADSVVSVTPIEHPVQWTQKIDDQGRLRPYFESSRLITRRQDSDAAYVLNGAIYVAHREVLIREETFYTDRTYGYVMPPERSFDIDSPWDFHLAELIMAERLRRRAEV